MSLSVDAPAGGVTGNKSLAPPVYILDGYQTTICYPPPFTGGTTNTRGNINGTLDPMTLFVVTGEVKAIVYGVCTVALAGATAQISIGIDTSTSLFISGTLSTDLVAGEVWIDNSPTEVVGVTSAQIAVLERYITNGNNIVENYAAANTTSGDIYYVCLWIPISNNGNVRATSTNPN